MQPRLIWQVLDKTDPAAKPFAVKAYHSGSLCMSCADLHKTVRPRRSSTVVGLSQTVCGS